MDWAGENSRARSQVNDHRNVSRYPRGKGYSPTDTPLRVRIMPLYRSSKTLYPKGTRGLRRARPWARLGVGGYPTVGYKPRMAGLCGPGDTPREASKRRKLEANTGYEIPDFYIQERRRLFWFRHAEKTKVH